ncbi:hypothetical protein [Arthrobacter sp.]|uniref:hypothetical protein n=1 Tax=Arthrobacter sp. TaxID=1667 RepID=UPI00259112CE|nr:hypothetical protein [Arthrobacter sp.]
MESDSITTSEAAMILGMSTRRVRALVSTGQLMPLGRMGPLWVLDRRQVFARSRQSAANKGWSPTAHTGRRWSERTAWAAISLLDSRDSGLEPPALSRLRRRMDGIDVDRLAWLAGGRARLQTFEGLAGDAAYLRQEILASGLQALSDGAGSGPSGVVSFGHDVDGYVSDGRLPGLIAKYSLSPTPAGPFKIRTVTSERFAWLQANGVPKTAVALDMLDDGAPRTRSQAERLLLERIAGLTRKA